MLHSTLAPKPSPPIVAQCYNIHIDGHRINGACCWTRYGVLSASHCAPYDDFILCAGKVEIRCIKIAAFQDVMLLKPDVEPPMHLLNLSSSMPPEGYLVRWWGLDNDYNPLELLPSLLDAGLDSAEQCIGQLEWLPGMVPGVSGSPVLTASGELCGITKGILHGDNKVVTFSNLWAVLQAVK